MRRKTLDFDGGLGARGTWPRRRWIRRPMLQVRRHDAWGYQIRRADHPPAIFRTPRPRAPSRYRVGSRHLRCLGVAIPRIGYEVVGGLRLPSLCHSEWPRPLWDEWHRDTGQDEARQDRDGQDVLLDLIVPCSIWQAEHNMLHLVIYPPARLKGLGRRIGG